MKSYEFDVDLKLDDLYRYTMRHTYFQLSGVFGILISVGSLILCYLNRRIYSSSTIFVLIFVGLLFTVIQPIMLYSKCKMQMKKNEGINAPLHYTLSEEGIEIEQQEQTAEVKWYDVRKVVKAKGGQYIYMSPARAFIFPKKQCGQEYEEIASMVTAQVKKYRDFVPEESTETEEQAPAKEEFKDE